MGFRIQNNIAAMTSLRHLNSNEQSMNKALERLSSGYRINSAADDAAGMASSMRFRAEVSSLKVGSRNASEATSLLQVAEGAMGEIEVILNRVKELSTQAASGNAGSDLSKINAEASALTTEINRIVGFTEYNGSTLLDGTYGAVDLSTSTNGFTNANGVEKVDVANAKNDAVYYVSAISDSANYMDMSEYVGGATTLTQRVDITAAKANSDINTDVVLDFSSLGVKVTVNADFDVADYTAGSESTGSRFDTKYDLGNANFQIGNKNDGNSQLGFTLQGVNMNSLNNGSALSIDLSTTSGAQAALNDIDVAIGYLAERRSDAGALINRLSYAQSNLAVMIENKTASESIIRDVDMAAEMSTFTKNQILVQSSTSMLAQANASQQTVLSLLR